MNEECKFFESRSYPNGETVRKCDLDLAPEAPWRCPDACPAYQPRLADVNWAHGSLVVSPTPPEPVSLGSDSSIGDLLDEAEDIVNAAAPQIMNEVDIAPRGDSHFGPTEARGWRKFFRRRS